jgi:hypothetical protein
VKTLISTFGEEDFEKIMEAMRRLPYEQLVLVGETDLSRSETFERIRDFEEMSGHGVEAELVEGEDFMDLVEQVSEVLEKRSRPIQTGERNSIILNISGGSKLLGDAALFAAFRLGIMACHCDGRMTMLPVVSGATATDRFSPVQAKFIRVLDKEYMPLDDILERMGSQSKQAVERVIRELRKLDLLRTEVVDGRIQVALSDAGAEVSRALRTSGVK